MFYIVANKILYPKAITVFGILGLKMAFFNNNVPKNYQKIAKKKKKVQKKNKKSSLSLITKKCKNVFLFELVSQFSSI